MTEVVRLERRDDGVVLLVQDDPGRSANTITAAWVAGLTTVLDELESLAAAGSLTGVVVTSAKDSFLVGMDLKEFTAGALSGGSPAGDAAGGSAAGGVTAGGVTAGGVTAGGVTAGGGAAGGGSAAGGDAAGGGAAGGGAGFAAAVFAAAGAVKALFRRLERLGRPVVAALPGTALGGGLELALACHHRIALDHPAARFGLPEVSLGLLPGGGGVTRVVRMLGVQDALTKVLLQGQRMRAAQAREVGLLDDLAADRDELLAKAVAWIGANPSAAQPWDRRGYRLPGGRPTDRELATMLPAFPANLRKQLKGAHYPAPLAIMSAAVEGAGVDVDTALTIEGRWFASLVGTPVQRNLTQAFFFDLQHLNRGGSRPRVGEVPPVRRLGVVGAGMMGAGIAYAAARVGLDVVLVDVSAEAAARGKAYSQRLLDKAVQRGRSTADKREAHLARITPTDSLDDLAGCDAVIEAVFEDAALKHETFRRVCAVVGPDALIASNTSSLPITSLAGAVDGPGRFLGLHFFSPVDRMQLVEIVRGRDGVTSDAALARGYDLVRKLDKTPIVVNDSRGFFTSRVFGVRVMEGVAMLGEGLPATSIEQAALQAGYPVGPLAVLDEVTLSLGLRLRNEARRAGVPTPSHPGEAVLERMVEEFGRPGKAAGRGFYDYPQGEPKRLWPGLAEHFGPPDPERARAQFADMRDRLLFIEAVETLRCRAEGVLTGTEDANIGSILGIGFPPWTGGALQFVEQYPGGRPAFDARARDLATRYGDRFLPPPPP